MSGQLSRKERNAATTIRKSIQNGHESMGYTIDNELIAMLPQSVVYYFFKSRLEFYSKNVTVKEVREFCREWYDNAALSPSDGVFLYFLQVCAHEFAHFKLNHAERNISIRKAETEAREFEHRVAEMLVVAVFLNQRMKRRCSDLN